MINHPSSMRTHHTHGFTLIELLVVISIIGMLSSVIMVALQSARDKGQVGAALKFASYNHRLLGVDVLAAYMFNETPAASAADSSGNSLNASMSVSCSSGQYCRPAVMDTPNLTGNSLILNGSAQYAYYSSAAALTPASLTGATISVWIKPTNFSNPANVVTVVSNHTTDGNLNRDMYIDVRPNGTMDIEVKGCTRIYPADTIQLNKWQQVTVSLNGTTATVYLNGKVLGAPFTSCMASPPLPRFIGIGTSTTGGANLFIGLIDDVMVYTQALAASDIERIYAAGALEHLEDGLSVAQ